MNAITREQVSNALLALLLTANFVTVNSQGQAINFVTSGRRLRFWDEVNGSQMPALFLTELKETHVRQELQTPTVRSIMYHAFIYINDGANKAPIVTPITTLNNILDSIDPRYGGVLKPDVISNRQTLGNLVYDCYIEGEPEKMPGDLDGQGLMTIPIKVIMP